MFQVLFYQSLKLNICSVVLPCDSKLACSSSKICSAWFTGPLRSTRRTILLGWLIELVTLSFWQSHVLPFFRRGTISDCIQFLGHHPLVQILWHMTVKASIIPGPSCFRTSAGMSSISVDFSCLRFARYSHQFLMCSCTARCSTRSIICGWLSFLLRFCPSYFQLTLSLSIVTELVISECWKPLYCFLFWSRKRLLLDHKKKPLNKDYLILPPFLLWCTMGEIEESNDDVNLQLEPVSWNCFLQRVYWPDTIVQQFVPSVWVKCENAKMVIGKMRNYVGENEVWKLGKLGKCENAFISIKLSFLPCYRLCNISLFLISVFLIYIDSIYSCAVCTPKVCGVPLCSHKGSGNSCWCFIVWLNVSESMGKIQKLSYIVFAFYKSSFGGT